MKNEDIKNGLQDSGECEVTEDAVADSDVTLADGADGADFAAAAEDTEEPRVPEYEPKNRYEKLLYSVYRDDTLSEIFRIASYAIVLLTAYAFFVRLAGLIETPIEVFKILAVTGVPFVAVSVIRHVINAPRPYELLEFYEKKPKGKSGKSFPSRHVFSVFVIATVLITWNPAVALGLAVLGAILAFLRVALGIHFVRDVAAGAAVGVVSGVIGLLVLKFV